MSHNRKIYFVENSLYLFILLVAVLSPMFRHLDRGGDLRFFFHDWMRLIPFLFVFLVNNNWLAPKLLLKSKFSTYFILVVILIMVASLLEAFPLWDRHPPMHGRGGGPPPDFKPMFNFGFLIISLLIVGFNSGVKIIVRWIESENERKEMDHHYLNAELAYLKHQLSPHFFMNTLNNIHALVDLDSDRAKDSIIRLSRLMRYLLYETDGDKVLLKKEIEFIESYIKLMRLRYDESLLSIDLVYPPNVQSIYIPSLLFLPLIENAFKHGVHSSKKCFIDILFEISDGSLSLVLKNSNFPKNTTSFNEASGLGLDNIRKRLDLIYKDQYKLMIGVEDNVFEVSLIIPIEYA